MSAPVGYLILNDAGIILEANRLAATLLATPVLQGLQLKRLVIAEDQETYLAHWNRLFRTGGPQDCELRMFRSSGSFWANLKMTLKEENGAPVCRMVAFETTDRKNHELSQQAEEERLSSALTHNETQTKEIHHRVRNNLQLISGLLRLQAELLTDAQASAVLRDCHQRVLSLALIHERLYGHETFDEIDFGQFIQTLVKELFNSYGRSSRLNCQLNLSHTVLSSQQAIPCGLIVNELVTNSLKYAYPEGQPGEVHIQLNETAAGLVQLTVSDQGIGLPPSLDWKNAASMGLPIVDVLAKQIGGKLIVGPPPGASFTVEFMKQQSGLALSAAAAGQA